MGMDERSTKYPISVLPVESELKTHRFGDPCMLGYGRKMKKEDTSI